MSVDVATVDELQKFNLFDAKDIQRLSPGLEMSNDLGDAGAKAVSHAFGAPGLDF